jgi:hypothetical protein
MYECSSELLLDMPSQIFTSQRLLASGLMLIVLEFHFITDGKADA